MASQIARQHPANNSDSNTQARHTEIARRYAWQAQQRRKLSDDKPGPARLLTLIRMRELERLFVRRWGRVLPDDDAGRDDLIVAAHHIAFLRGDVSKHIVDWASAWAPWMPPAEAEEMAERVAAEPRKWNADALAWRLRLSWAERTELRITTIGAFDMNKAARGVERKKRRREAERVRRANRSTGRPRGRPKKCVASRDITIAGHGFSADEGDAARELPMTAPAVSASKENQSSTSRAARPFGLGEGRVALPRSADPRAAASQQSISNRPPPEVLAKAVEIAREHVNRGCSIGTREALRLIVAFWPGYVAGQRRVIARHYGRPFYPIRDLRNWEGGFKSVLDREYDSRDRFRERRRKWVRGRRAIAATSA